MAVEKWIAGATATYTAAFSTETNSIVNGNAILSSVAIANGTNLDQFMDISVSMASITPVSPAFLAFYIHPLNEDGTTYGDGRFASSAAGPPFANYYAGNIILVQSAGVQVGTLSRIIMPPTNFKLVLYNQAGVTLSTGNTIDYKTYNRSVA